MKTAGKRAGWSHPSTPWCWDPPSWSRLGCKHGVWRSPAKPWGCSVAGLQHLAPPVAASSCKPFRLPRAGLQHPHAVRQIRVSPFRLFFQADGPVDAQLCPGLPPSARRGHDLLKAEVVRQSGMGRWDLSSGTRVLQKGLEKMRCNFSCLPRTHGESESRWDCPKREPRIQLSSTSDGRCWADPGFSSSSRCCRHSATSSRKHYL